MRTRGLLVPLAVWLALVGCSASRPTRSGSAGDAATPSVKAQAPALPAVPQDADRTAAAPALALAPTPSAPKTAPAPIREPQAASTAPKPAGAAPPERYVSLNFDNADISVVIQTIAELLRLNYIVAPTVRGRVTIQSTEKLPVSTLLPVLEQILSVNNFTAVKSGEFYKIVPTNQAKQESVETIVPGQAPTVGTGLVTKIVPLRYIGPGEVAKVLTPFKSPAGIYQGYEPARLLFLTEVPTKIADLMKIVEVLDVDSFASIQVELYPVRYAGVEDLARELTQIVTMIYTAAGRGRTVFRIVPVTQANALMVFSGEPGLATNIREWIAKLDQPASEANERIFVYPLSHANAETLAAVIEKVFHRDAPKGQAKTATPTTAQPAPQRIAPAGQPMVVPQAAPVMAAPAGAVSSEGVSASGAAPVVVVADKDTNALIIQTASWFYPTVEEMIRKLDSMPRQVLIEVLIAEISLDDTNQFGIQWALKGQGSLNAFGENHNLLSTTQNVFPSEGKSGVQAVGTGFSFFVTEANRVTAAINAYANAAKLNILSAPHILASNNKEAKIDVGSEIPILKTKTTATTGSSTTDTVTNDIEYRSTGIILTVTPHVNEGGYVTLDLQQEVSEAQKNELGGTDSPIIRKRTAKTTMVVKDDQTLVIGGLIQEKRSDSKQGIPGLSKIPVLGYLFGSTGTTVSKTELVLLITPRVIDSVAEGDRLTKQLEERVLTLKKGIDSFRKPIGEPVEGAP